MREKSRLDMDDAAAAIERESFSAFIVDLEGGTHAVVVLDRLSVDDALECVTELAAEEHESLIVVGRAESAPQQSRDRLDDDAIRGLRGFAEEARRDGAGGLFVAIDAAASMRHGGALAHVAAEARLHADEDAVPPDARVVCIYALDDSERLLDVGGAMLVARAHTHALIHADREEADR